jgi:hypothetical protein
MVDRNGAGGDAFQNTECLVHDALIIRFGSFEGVSRRVGS